MRYLIAAALMLLTPLAFAATPSPDLALQLGTSLVEITPDIIVSLLVAVLGSKGTAIAIVIGTVVGVWARIRPYIPNTWLAKLPTPLIRFLEWWAGNDHHAKNDSLTGPEALRARAIK